MSDEPAPSHSPPPVAIPAPASTTTTNPNHALASDLVAPSEAASLAAECVEIEDFDDEEELLDWDVAEEAEDIAAAPMAMDGGGSVLLPDLPRGQAGEAPVPGSDADMDAAASSPSSGGSIGEGQIDGSSGVLSSPGPASAAPPGVPRQPKLGGRASKAVLHSLELDPPTSAEHLLLPKLKSILVRPSMVHAPCAAPVRQSKRVWRCLKLGDEPMDGQLEHWTQRSRASASQKGKGSYSPPAGSVVRGEYSSPKWQQARKRHWWRKDRAQMETVSVKTRSEAELPSSAIPSAGREAFMRRLGSRCFRCLASDHQVAHCRDPIRCLRCNGVGHTSRLCPSRRCKPISNNLQSRLIFPAGSIHSRLVFPPLNLKEQSQNVAVNLTTALSAVTTEARQVKAWLSDAQVELEAANTESDRLRGLLQDAEAELRSAAERVGALTSVWKDIALRWRAKERALLARAHAAEEAVAIARGESSDLDLAAEGQVLSNDNSAPRRALKQAIDEANAAAEALRATSGDNIGLQEAIVEKEHTLEPDHLAANISDLVSQMDIDVAPQAVPNNGPGSGDAPGMDGPATWDATIQKVIDTHASEVATAEMGTEEVGDCAKFCAGMFKPILAPVLERPMSPPPTSNRGRKRAPVASSRSSARLAARPSSVPVAERAQRKLMRELSFINGKSAAPDAAITAYVDMYGNDLPQQAIKAIRAATRLDNKVLSKALAALAAESGAAEMEEVL